MRKEIIFISGRSTVAPPTIITNYVFDGSLNSYMGDEAIVPTMLDGIVNQTWVIRVKRTVNAHQHGILGMHNAVNGVKLEVDADDDRIDGELRDTGSSAFTNGVVTLDGSWQNYFFFYDGTNLGVYEGNNNVIDALRPDFIARTNGRALAVGAAVIGGAVPGYLIGEVSDVQFYNRRLTVQEIADLNTDLANTTTGLIANFAGNKTATEWTSEIGGFILTNQGGVTYI